MGMDGAQPWLAERATLPVGPLFCVIAGPTRGHAWSAGAARLQLHQIAVEAASAGASRPTIMPSAGYADGEEKVFASWDVGGK